MPKRRKHVNRFDRIDLILLWAQILGAALMLYGLLS